MKKWVTLSSKLVFNNRWFKVKQDKVRLPSGKVIDDYFMWIQGDVNKVVPITPDGKMILIKQYKHAVGKFTIEFPGGFVDEKENNVESTRRELLEETGYISDKIINLALLYENPTKTVGRMHLYLAMNAKFKGFPVEHDKNEEIEVLKLDYNKVLEKIRNKEIFETTSVAALYLALEKLGKIKF